MRNNRTGVSWDDVWAWMDEIRDEHGRWGQVRLAPSLPSDRRNLHGQAVIHWTWYNEGGLMGEDWQYCSLPSPSRARAEDVVLGMVANYSRQLDWEAYQRERASLKPEEGSPI